MIKNLTGNNNKTLLLRSYKILHVITKINKTNLKTGKASKLTLTTAITTMIASNIMSPLINSQVNTQRRRIIMTMEWWVLVNRLSYLEFHLNETKGLLNEMIMNKRRSFLRSTFRTKTNKMEHLKWELYNSSVFKITLHPPVLAFRKKRRRAKNQDDNSLWKRLFSLIVRTSVAKEKKIRGKSVTDCNLLTTLFSRRRTIISMKQARRQEISKETAKS